jgi:hypothetical protein
VVEESAAASLYELPLAVGCEVYTAILGRFLASRSHEERPFPQEGSMRSRGKAPTTAVFLICLVLYLVALAAHFAIIHIDVRLAEWAWIIGFGLLLLAIRVRGL